MANQKALGLLFPGMHDEVIPEMNEIRALGSLPFGGRYRLIDFPLSCMVNAGINKVGVITKARYQSLMDHIGSGKAWDLSRKNEGLYFLPPADQNDEAYAGRIASLKGIRQFLINSKEDLVVMADCHVIANIDYKRLVEEHAASGADITVAYIRGALPKRGQRLAFTVDESGRVTRVAINPPPAGETAVGIGLYVIGRELLIQLVDTAVSEGKMHFDRSILQEGVGRLNIRGALVTEYTRLITSLEEYFAANMDLLDPAVRQALFPSKRPIFTKVRDGAPALYGLDATVTNSLVADGARVYGTVKNSIIFRDAVIEEGAVVENAIVMQGSVVGKNARLESTILDKEVTVTAGRSLCGCETYPMYVTKKATV